MFKYHLKFFTKITLPDVAALCGVFTASVLYWKLLGQFFFQSQTLWLSLVVYFIFICICTTSVPGRLLKWLQEVLLLPGVFTCIHFTLALKIPCKVNSGVKILMRFCYWFTFTFYANCCPGQKFAYERTSLGVKRAWTKGALFILKSDVR